MDVYKYLLGTCKGQLRHSSTTYVNYRNSGSDGSALHPLITSSARAQAWCSLLLHQAWCMPCLFCDLTVTDHLFRDLPGDVLATPASATSGWKGVILTLTVLWTVLNVGATISSARLAGTGVILLGSLSEAGWLGLMRLHASTHLISQAGWIRCNHNHKLL